ncbi:hypothetical protein TWF694_002593 [Orbilia ellipsospora]|uniref:EthD domain-containing protein n=1 Tax=Orbilia ellipsospora TaxID=2528407 RepID=A0AAV9X503_9PEZI
MDTEKCIRVTMLFKKLSDLSYEQFHEHWAHTHAPLCTKWMQRYGIVKYTQNHIKKSLLKGLVDAVGWVKTADYDGIADFYVRDLESFTNAIADDYYINVLVPDAGLFSDMSNCLLTVGEDYLVVDDSKVIEKHQRDYRRIHIPGVCIERKKQDFLLD